MEDENTSNPGQPTAEGGQPSADTPPLAPPAAPPAAPVVDSAPKGKKTKFVAFGAVAALVLASIFVITSLGGSSAKSYETISIAYDPRGDGSYYAVEMKDGKALVGGRIASDDLGSIDVRADLNDGQSTSQPLVGIDKNTVMFKQYPEGSEEDSAEFVKVDLKTMQQTVLFNAPDGAQGIYVASEQALIVTDRNACYKVDLDGVSSRLGDGTCYVSGGRITVEEQSGEDLRIVTVDDKGTPSPAVSISISTIDGFNKDRTILWGRNSDGSVVVFDAVKGTQIWTDGSNEKLVKILGASRDGKSFLVTIDEIVNSDAKVDLAVVRQAEGSPVTTVLVSAFNVGGAIAPDGKTVLAYTRDQESSSGTLLYFDESLKTNKTIATNVTMNDIGVASNGLAVAITDRAIYGGSFAKGFEEKANGAFTDIWDNYYSVIGTDAMLMNLVGADRDSGGGDNQLLYVPSPLAVDGGSNSIVVASGDKNPYLISQNSLARDGSIVFATKSDDYLIFNQRELKKDAETTRLIEGRLEGTFEIDNEKLVYFEKSGSDRFTTYQLKGTDATKREIVAEGYFIIQVPIGAPKKQLERVSWDYYSTTAQIDDDLDECRSNGDAVINIGESATVELKVNSTSSYVWTRFCVQNSSSGGTTVISTSNSDSYDSGKSLWMRLRCWDKDTNSSYHFDNRDIVSEGGGGSSGFISGQPNGSFATCEIADNAYHGGYYTSSYSNGGTVSVSVGTYDEGAGSGD